MFSEEAVVYSMVFELIKNHYHCMDPIFVKPINEKIYKTIRRGLRWVQTRAGWEKTTSDKVLWTVLKNMGITGKWKPKGVESEEMK